MKSFILSFLTLFITIASFSQKANTIADTTINSYLVYSCPMHPQYVSNVAAKCPVCKDDMTRSKKEQLKREVVKLYTCPMDTEVISTKGGKCPVCNMDLVEFNPKNKATKE